MLRKILCCTFVFFMLVSVSAKNDYNRNVVRSKSDVWIKRIPQVNAKRAYSVQAAVSMVVRYLNDKLNQKKMAPLYQLEAEKGVMTPEIEGLFQSDPVFREFKIKTLYKISEPEISRMMELYDSSSKRKRKSRKAPDEKTGNVFDTVNRETARRMFPTARPQMASLLRGVCYRYIDAGVPVLWSVAMNLDPAVKMKGGHMRLIVGYNEQNKKIKKIFYRDPWGGSTKIKQADFEDAQTMTMELHVITPMFGEVLMPLHGTWNKDNRQKRYIKKRRPPVPKK